MHGQNVRFPLLDKRRRRLLPAARGNIILYAVDKYLNKDSRNQATAKSDPQPEHISPYDSKQNDKNAQNTHHGSEKGFQRQSPVSGRRANLGRWSISHGRMLLPP